ncbi:MAG: tRNA lysidine(34) synthetase TilS [Oscillospiraceae bacterium]|nr:tRNA lysidine(34) synthetase TilS [Oscillospiraceae bacterium]
MITKVVNAIEKYEMLKLGDCVIVALSGGADSVSLLHALNVLRERLGISLRAVHVNHMLRGEEAERDSRFSCSFCESLGIPIDVFRVDIGKLAKERKIGTEQCGREERYRLLAEVREKFGGRIATAHTLSDNAETMLLNMTRGCSVAGLRGIPPVRGDIIRPLIFVTRAEVEQYCRENSLDFVTDSSNLSDGYTRNKIRLGVIPRLTEINPLLELSMSRLSECASEDDRYLSSAAAEFSANNKQGDCFSLDSLRALPLPILKRVLIGECRDRYGIDCDFRRLELLLEIIDRGAGAVSLSKEITASIYKNRFKFSRKGKAITEWCVDMQIPFSRLPDGREVRFELTTLRQFEEKYKFNKFLFKNAIDYDTISANPCIRGRRQADSFRPVSRGLSKPVRKLFNEFGIEPEKRGNMAIISDEKGIVWIERFGADESRKISETTERVLVIKLEEDE